MTDALGEHVSPGVIPLEQGLHLSAQHLYDAEVGSGHQPGTPVSRYYARFIAWHGRNTQPPKWASQPQKHTPSVCTAARYPGRSTAEGLAALTPASMRGRWNAAPPQRSLPRVPPHAGRRMAPMPNGESTLAAALNSLAWLGTERDRE